MSNKPPGILIPFLRPMKIGSNTYTSVTMRDCTVADEIAAAAESKTDSRQEIEARLVARLCDLPADGVLAMRSALYRVIQSPLLVLISTPWIESDEPSSSSAGSADGDAPKSGE